MLLGQEKMDGNRESNVEGQVKKETLDTCTDVDDCGFDESDITSLEPRQRTVKSL